MNKISNTNIADQIIGDKVRQYLTDCNINSLDNINNDINKIMLKYAEIYNIKPGEIRFIRYPDKKLKVEAHWNNSSGESIYLDSIVM